MKILFVVKHYSPDGSPVAQLFKMLCEALARTGHDVFVITSVPHYPSGYVPRGYRGKLIYHSRENGATIKRVAIPSLNRSNLALRLLQFIAFQINAILAGRKIIYDVVIMHTSALEMWLPFMFFSVVRKKPAIYSVHDLYPEIGIKMGIFRNPLLIKFISFLERSCLNKARKVRILSRSFITGLKELGVPESKMVLIYDWVDTDKIKPLPKGNRFSLINNLTERFCVLYAGNIGLPQGLETLIEAARLLQKEQSICFLLVGDGAAKELLLNKVKELALENVHFLPYQPQEYMPEILASADVSLVLLKRGTGFGALPSKTYTIMASGRPIIACVDEGSDVWSLIQRTKAGICVEPENPKKLAEAIIKLKTNSFLCKQLGKNGREHVLLYHSPQSAADAFNKMFYDAAR